VTRLIATALALAALVFCSAARSADCADQLQQDLSASRTLPPAQRMPDLTLYIQFYTCVGRPAAEAQAFAVLRVQLARAGEDYIGGSLSPAAYRAFLLDRQRKAELMQKSPSYAAAVGQGDSDGDLVPDSADQCPGTAPPLAPTDDQGCNVRCPPLGALAEGKSDPVCLAAAPPNSPEDPLRPFLDASVPVNLSCDDTPPAASALFGWGPRSTTVISGRPVPFATVDTRSGFYFQVRRTSTQAPGCEIWYALQFVFRSPLNLGLPSIDIVSVLFSSAEDETAGDPLIARFPMITNHSQIEGDVLKFSTDLPLSPGRTRLRDNLVNYGQVSVRVRVVTGSQQASPWSVYLPKDAGPAVED
jgi:hypothetical protein